MKKLQEIIQIVSPNKVKSIEIISSGNNSKTKLNRLYHGISEEKFLHDEDAITVLYPFVGKKNAYYKLKHLLLERLYNTLFFIDAKKAKYSSLLSAYLECKKQQHLLALLMSIRAWENAIHVGEKALKLAQKFEFSLEAMTIAKDLAVYYATAIGNRKKFLHYDQLFRKYQELFNVESAAQTYLLDVTSFYVNSRSSKSEVHHLAKEYVEKLNSIKIRETTSNLIYYQAMLELSIYMSNNDFEKTLQIAEEARRKLIKHPVVNLKNIINISLQEITCSIQLKQHKRGIETIEELLKLTSEKLEVWFKIHELLFTLYLHTRDYQEAWLVFQKVSNNKKFKTLPPNWQEIWKVYEAWLFFLAGAGKIQIEEKHIPFKVNKYLNEVPVFSKDKKGVNVPILISQILLLLQQNKRDVLIEKVDAINTYKNRHLDARSNYRSNLFLRMLLTIPKKDFSRKEVSKNCKKHLSLLREVPMEIANQSHDIEIMPFEDVWMLVLDFLD